MSRELAAIVEKTSADTIIRRLKEADAYDANRRIREYDDGHLAIPVQSAVSLDGVDRITTDDDPDRRLRTLADRLRAAGWTAAECDRAPNSYSRIGDVIVVDDPIEYRPDEIGEALLEMHGDTRAVFAIHAISGSTRTPHIERIAGDGSAETVHVEHGIEYALDLDAVMFSPGNQRERVRMGELVGADEHLYDMCAGIGYFTLPMASTGATVVAVEQNPTAFRWLSENTHRNGVSDRVTPICGDARALSPPADRAVIGHLPVHDCRDGRPTWGDRFLDAALQAIRPRGWLHVHGIAWSDEIEQAGTMLDERVRQFDMRVRSSEVRSVKGIAERTDHVVIDACVEAP